VAYETKVILKLLADRIATADSIQEGYEAVRDAANVEGMELPTFEEVQKKRAAIKAKAPKPQ